MLIFRLFLRCSGKYFFFSFPEVMWFVFKNSLESCLVVFVFELYLAETNIVWCMSRQISYRRHKPTIIYFYNFQEKTDFFREKDRIFTRKDKLFSGYLKLLQRKSNLNLRLCLVYVHNYCLGSI